MSSVTSSPTGYVPCCDGDSRSNSRSSESSHSSSVATSGNDIGPTEAPHSPLPCGPGKDPDSEARLDVAVEAVIQQLTDKEKVDLLSGRDMWSCGGIPRLDLPALVFTDGPNGARGASMHGDKDVSAGPCEVAAAASFNEALLEALGDLCGQDCRKRGAHVLLGPTINLQRYPISGRHFECYSEDPFLTGRCAAAWVRGVQRHVAACAKHFVGNDQETDRNTSNSIIDERTLREVYLAPFEECVMESGVEMAMCGYNRLNGSYCTENTWLLQKLLREEWGFKGTVISDWFGNRSTHPALQAGLNIEMPGVEPRFYGGYLLDAVTAEYVSEELLDERCRPVLRTLLRRRGEDACRGDTSEQDLEQRQALLKRAASESLVLLQNRSDTLPLDAGRLQSVAILGPNAANTTIQGGGSSRCHPRRSKAIYESLREELEAHGIEVFHEKGCETEWLPSHMFTNELGGIMIMGNSDAYGQPAGLNLYLEFVERFMAAASWFSNCEFFRIVCMPMLRRLGLRLSTPEEAAKRTEKDRAKQRSIPAPTSPILIALLWFLGAAVATSALCAVAWSIGGLFAFYVCAGISAVLICVAGLLRLSMSRRCQSDDRSMEAAVRVAKIADVCILVLGTHGQWEIESVDQPHPRLLGKQDELVARVAAVAKGPVIVILNVGSPKELPWIDSVHAILLAHFGGEQMAPAVTDAILGFTTPAGKLPTTWPRSYADVPAVVASQSEAARNVPNVGDLLYAEGLRVGYRGYESGGPSASATPLFCFGHGLSYTTFSCHQVDVQVLAPCSSAGGPQVALSALVKNTGARDGAEVVQLYVTTATARREVRVWDADLHSTGTRPPALRALRGFHRTQVLAPGAEEQVELILGPRSLGRFFDVESGCWQGPEPGTEVVLDLCKSSADVIASRTVRLP